MLNLFAIHGPPIAADVLHSFPETHSLATATALPALKTTYRRLSPVFLVDRVEPCIEFWAERLGFDIRLQVDGADGIEFVILGKDDAEVIYRSAESLNLDAPGLLDSDHQPWDILHVQVDDLEEILPRLDGLEIVVPLRESGFGGREIYVTEPSGRLVAITSSNEAPE